MPVHVERLTTDVTAGGGELPLSREQIELLVRLVLERLEQQRRGDDARRAETRLRPHAQPLGHDE